MDNANGKVKRPLFIVAAIVMVAFVVLALRLLVDAESTEMGQTQGQTVDQMKVAGKFNDYPTYARAEYVFVCMSSNGESEYVLRQCSCAIDEIARRMPYDDYVAAETAVRMRQLQGEKAAQFREVEVIKNAVTELQEAQAEAEIACF